MIIKRKNSYKLCCLVLCFLIALSLFIIPVQADDSKVIVGWYEDSYHITGKKGERSGYGYEYEQAVASYTGWKYKYEEADWSKLLEKLENGEIDLMAAISYTDERAQHMLFSELPMGKEKYYLYVDLVNTDISPSNMTSLNGKKIAMLEKSVQTTQFFDWEQKNNVHMQPVYVENIDEAKKKAENHEIDGVISTETPIWVGFGMSAIVTTGESNIYYAINKNRPDLKIKLDNAMRKMEYDQPFYADDLYKKYLSAVATPVLSKEEKDWVKKHGKIKIGCLNDDEGFSQFDYDSGEIDGVITDYIINACDCLKNQELKFELQGFDSPKELLKALKDDKIDMIFHFVQNPYVAEENNLILSNTLLNVALTAVTTKKDFNEDEKNSVAIKKGNLLLKWSLAYNYPNWKIVECNSDKEVEKAVSQKKADCFVLNSNRITSEYENKFNCISLTKSADTSFALNREDVMLMSIINKTLKTIPTSKLTGALAVYTNNLKKVTISDFIKDNFIFVSFFAFFIFLMILLIILKFLKKSRNAEVKARQAAQQALELNRKLEKSQQELQIALKQAKNANLAKTEFLNNMSHDIRTPMNALLGYAKLMNKELTDPKLLHYQENIEQSGQLLLSIINNILDMSRIESGKMELDENYAYIMTILEEVDGIFESEAKKKEIVLVYENQVIHQHIMCDSTKYQQILINLISNAIKYTSPGGKVTVRLQELPTDEGFVKIKTEVIDTGIGMSKEFIPTLFDSFTREKNTTIGKVAGTGLGMPIVKKLVEMMKGTIEVESELGKGSKFTVILKHQIADEKYYIKESNKNIMNSQIIQGKHVLLAEDNDLNAEITMTLLKDMGLNVERVEDGIQCVAMMEKMPAKSYDFILMDIQMPHMDGYKATQTIRQLSDQEKANIPIIALTANAFEEDKKAALLYGMNSHISKPMDIQKLEKVIIQVLNKK